MTSTNETAKRPAAITGICVLGLIGAVALAYLAASGGVYSLPGWYMPYLAFSVIVGLTALLGLFLMRKWGFHLYAGMFALNQLVLLSTNLWSVQSVIAPLIVLIVASRHLKAMR